MKNNYFTAKITNIENETPKVKNFVLNINIKAKPGQYVMVWLPRKNEKPFGVVQSSPLVLSIAKAGPFTEKIHQLKKGDKFTFRGPYGRGFKLRGNRWLFAGGGYGVAPLYFLASTILVSKRKNLTVVIGARTKDDLLFVGKFKKLGIKALTATDDGSAGIKGFVTQLVEKLLAEEKFTGIYTCGPKLMMEKIAAMANNKKIFCQVSLEQLFKCGGIGLCGECGCKGKLVCKDGPVFSGLILIN